MRRGTGGRSGRGTGRQCVCHVVSSRARWPAFRQHSDCHVRWRASRRLAASLAAEAGPTPANGIRPDPWRIAPREWSSPVEPSWFKIGWRRIEEIGIDPVLQGLDTALILAIVRQVRDRHEQIRIAALAEVRAPLRKHS